MLQKVQTPARENTRSSQATRGGGEANRTHGCGEADVPQAERGKRGSTEAHSRHKAE